MIAAFEQHVRECWGELAPGAPPPRRLHVLKLGLEDYPEPSTAMVFLVFADRAARPVAVVKAARVAAGDAGIRIEAAGLELVHRLLPAARARVVPRLLRRGEVNGREFFLASALPGEQEQHHTWGARGARRSQARIASALRWVMDAAREAPAAALRLGEWLALASPEEALAALAARGWTDDSLRCIEPRVRGAWDVAWPAGLAHGDYFPGNLLFERRELSGVVDWSFAAARAPIFLDALTYEVVFALHALQAGRPLGREAVHELAPFAAARRELGDQGVDAGLDSDARFAVLLAWTLRGTGVWVAHESASILYARLLRQEFAAAAARS